MKQKKLFSRVLSGTLAFLMAATPALQAAPITAQAEETNTVYTVNAPSEDLKIEFWLDESGTPWYQVISDGVELIEDAKLGLKTSLGELYSGLSIVGTPETSTSDTTWEPVVGEQALIRDHYTETSFVLTQEETGLTFGLEMRAYDEGAAFRYVLPEIPEGSDSYTISDEATQFVFPSGTKASLHISGNQTVPREYAVESLPSGTIRRPATFEYTDGQMLTICEGNLDNYSVLAMAKGAARTLEGNYAGTVTVSTEEGPAASPWRALVIGGQPTELLENDTMIQNLNEPADEETYQFSEWVDPGTCVRAATGMNNDAIKKVIDMAAEHGIRYVLLDTSWYGPEYDTNADPRLDPAALDPDNAQDQILLEKYFATEGGYNNTGEGVFNTRGVGFNVYGKLGDGGNTQVNVDIPALCDYANPKGVGIILYVNGVFFPDSGRNRFTADELFAYYEKWGVAGVKPGFVKCRTQAAEQHMEEVIAAAAKHKLVLTIHDEYVPAGLERTYPNLMMTEGILGDEGIGKNTPQAAEDITTLFTRNVQGPPDHTFCYPGKATKAYALASPILFRSGMSLLYWYTNPESVPAQDKGRLGIWDNMPTNWEESLYLEGSLYEYATTARRSAEDVWYVGSLSAITRTLKLPLDFLDEGVTYVADVYADGIDADPYEKWTTNPTAAKSLQTLENKQYLVTSETVLQRNLEYGFGYAVVLTKATEEDLSSCSAYNAYRQELELEVLRAEAIEADGYTTDSWAVLEAATAAAKEILANAEAADEQMEAARETLEEARTALVSPDALRSAIEKAGYYTSYVYTKESYAVLAEALEAAEELLDSEAYTQEQLDTAEKAITEGIAGLAKDPNAVVKSTVYLDELEYDADRSYAHANAIKKKVDYYNGTLSLMIAGVETVYERGMMTHAQSEVYYNIDGKGYEVFEAYVGIDTIKPTQGDVVFKVYGDDNLIYESNPSGNGSKNAQFFSIPIAGVKELRIEANKNGSNDGDHAVWADAKFLTYRDPDAYLDGITVAGKALEDYDKNVFEYYYHVADGLIPEVGVICAEEDVVYEIEKAEGIPGCTKIVITKRDGSKMTYKIYFLPTTDSDYISDLASLITKLSVHGGSVTKDKAYGNAELALTAADGSSKWSFAKGIGTHATTSSDSCVIYNIEGRGYDRFVGYVGISYTKNDSRASVNFKVYVDDETVPRFESGKMLYRTPAMYYNVDVRGAKTLKLVVDPCGDQSADHGCWCDAKFLKYTGIVTVSGTVDTGNTGLAKAGITVGLYKVTDGITAQAPMETVLTDENGAYTFTNILAGDYTVKVLKGENHLEAAEEITVADAAVVQNLLLQAPEFDIDITQPEGALVTADHQAASRDEVITVYVKNVPAGKLVSEVKITGKDGTVITAVPAEGKEGTYTFVMPQQEVHVQAEFAEDLAYQEALQAAQAIDEKILAVGEVTLDKKAQVEAVRAEYEQLSDAAKALVQELETLEHYEFTLDQLTILEKAEEAQAAAEAAESEAKAAAEAAKAAEENAAKAQTAAEEAAASAAEDKEAAESAKEAAEAAKAEAEAAQAKAEEAAGAAETAKEAAKAAQDAAEAAAEAAEASNREAAKEAVKAAEEAAKAAESAADAAEEARKATEASGLAADYAAQAAEAMAKAQEAQAKAEAAQKAAEEAAKKAEEDQAAAEAAQKAAEEAAKKAEEEKLAAEFLAAKQKTLADLTLYMNRIDTDSMNPRQKAAYDIVTDQAVQMIDQAESKEELDPILSDLEAEVDKIMNRVSAARFVDVPVEEWFYEEVDYVAFSGLMTGVDETHFAPYKTLTRAEFAVILYRMEGARAVETDEAFADVDPAEWYGPAILWAAEKGIVNGYETGLFGPADYITREQMVLMMHRYAGYLGKDTDASEELTRFRDEEEVSEPALRAMQWAVGRGIITGKEEGTLLDPQGGTLRAEAAAIIGRFMDLYTE